MIWSVPSLEKEILKLLDSSGFDPEQHMIKTGIDYVAVFFDMKEAVDYFRGDFETSHLAKDCSYEYRKEGKRHGAYIYSW